MSFLVEPVIKLEGVIAEPYDLAVATARTCYSSKGIVRTRDVKISQKAKELRDKIADSTREAGHLTTRQHAHFVFSLEKVSRHLIWSFLHAHPYYNSEQVSQRYVKVAPGNYAVPHLSEKHTAIFLKALDEQMQDYHQLIELCLPEVKKRFFEIFPSRASTAEKYDKELQKRAFENARYALGVATHAYLYHTISALTLMRYHRLSSYFDVPNEIRLVVQKMVEEVKKIDPDFERELRDPYPIEETIEYKILEGFSQTHSTSLKFTQEFDESLNPYQYSKLIDYKINTPKTLAKGVRSVLGLEAASLTDDAALAYLLNPKHNGYYSDTLNLNTLTKLNRVLSHAHYTFSKKISHAADSQDQRHRMVLGSRPVLYRHYSGKIDYVAPLVIRESAPLMEFFLNSLSKSFTAIDQLLNDGVSYENALYLLPNAFPIRFEESGDLLNLHHKWKARACYTAQEEIYFATIEELMQVKDVHPQVVESILAPCFLRKEAGVTPYCPEGDRFCGVRVWKQPLNDYLNRKL